MAEGPQAACTLLIKSVPTGRGGVQAGREQLSVRMRTGREPASHLRGGFQVIRGGG